MNFDLFFTRLLRHLATAAGFLALSCFALDAHAQNFPVNPNYNPVTPDYIEQEDCDFSNDIITFSASNRCAELITFPEFGHSLIVQGAVDSTFDHTAMDFYGFELFEQTDVKFKISNSHLIEFGIVVYDINTQAFYCEPGAELSSPNGYGQEVMAPDSDFSEFSFTLPAGKLVFGIAHFTFDDNFQLDHACGSIEYQVELSHDGFFSGDNCGLAIEIDPEDTFNESRVMDDMANAYSFGDYGCAYDIGQVERWYKFTAEKTTSFISARREGAGNFNPVIEVYDSCGGSPILCHDEDSGEQELVIFPTVPNQEYLFRVYHKGPQTLNSTALSAAVAHVPTTQLRSLDCNRMNLKYTDIIRSDWPANSFLLANWQFKFEMVEAPYSVYEITSPNGSNPQFRMTWFPQAEAGKTYIVSTRPRMYQGPTWGDYGSTCIIGTAPDFAAFTIPEMSDVEFGNAPVFGSHELRVWPNPAHNEVTFSFNSGHDDRSAQIALFDVSGKLVDSFRQGVSGASVQNVVYQTSALPGGVYLLQVQTDTGISTSKLIVSH